MYAMKAVVGGTALLAALLSAGVSAAVPDGAVCDPVPFWSKAETPKTINDAKKTDANFFSFNFCNKIKAIIPSQLMFKK
jgi:hypothetical protein